MSNKITAYFKGRVGVAESVYQNDYGMVMSFDAIDLPAHFDCYFSQLNQEEGIPGVGADNQVAIPNSVLANPGTVTIHIPLHTGVNDSEVEYVVYFKVIGRARPVDDGTPVQMTAIEQALALLQNPIGNIEQIVSEALSFTGETFEEMQEDLDEWKGGVEEDLDTWKSGVESDFDSLEAQFDTAVAAVTTDTEVTNIRVGADGVTYTTAGEAVRKQFDNVKDAIINLNDADYNISERGTNLLPVGTHTLVIGGVNVTYSNGSVTRSGTSTSVETKYLDDIIVLPAGTYTMFVEGQNTSAFELRDIFTNALIINANSGYKTVTLTQTRYAKFGMVIAASGVTLNDTKKVQVNKGSSELAWEEATITALDTVARTKCSVLETDVSALQESVDGINKVYTAESTDSIVGTDGTVKSPDQWKSFYLIENTDNLSEITFTFEHSPHGETTHWFNQFDSDDTLLSYTPFYANEGDNTSIDVPLLSNCAYLKFSVFTSNGDFTVSHYFTSELVRKSDISGGISKMSALGDSITWGYTPDGDITQTYLKQIADALGATYQKLGINSTPICPNSDYTGGQNANAFVYRWNQIDNDADLIVVAGGTNDYGHNVPLGTVSDATSLYETTFCGAVSYLITNLVSTYPNARIVFVAPFHRSNDGNANTAGFTLLQYVEAMQEICKKYGIKCIDGYAESGINTVSAFASVNLKDGIHPSQSGHNLIFKNLMPQFAML